MWFVACVTRSIRTWLLYQSSGNNERYVHDLGLWPDYPLVTNFDEIINIVILYFLLYFFTIDGNIVMLKLVAYRPDSTTDKLLY